MAKVPSSPNAETLDRSLRSVLILALVVLAARVLYLALFCRYDLVEDEAQYWLWSKFIDWSYYSKGPGVAWSIWLSTRVLGDAEWAVRLPTAVFSAIGAIAAGALVRDMAAWAIDRAKSSGTDLALFASPAKAGLFAAIAYTVAPALQMTGLLMTIDGPYVACWVVCCWCFWRGVVVGRLRAWVGVGAVIALGFLFKYTMLLVVPGLLVWLWLHVRRTRSRWPVAGLGVAAACASLGLLPVIIWNAQRDWPTVRHLMGHLGLPGGDVPASAPKDPWSPMWFIEFIAMQLGMIGPLLVLALITGLVLWRRAARAPASMDPRWVGQSLLLAAGLPILVFYVIIALFKEAEGNWALGAYATLLPLAGWLGADAIAALRRHVRAGAPLDPAERRALRTRKVVWRAGLVYALIAAVPIHLLTQIGDLAVRLSTSESFRARFNSVMHREPRDPVGRLRGAEPQAEHVLEVYHSLSPSSFIIVDHYGKACQLIYNMRDKTWGKDAINQDRFPPVICAMSAVGGRKSQFDYWSWNALDRPELLGKDAVIVGTIDGWALDRFRPMFASIDAASVQRLRGDHRPNRGVAIARSFRGLPQTAPPSPAEQGRQP
ncbi:MAG: glycosyltransferase family 39 protein [Phycisphaerales bacterium]|nr:glycosyltransferase family 39 protein [Phycisphaerales bacterium]